MILLKHAFLILVRPSLEWSAISAITITPLKLYLGYIVPLSAIGPVATTIRIVEFVRSNPSTQEIWVGFYWMSSFPDLIGGYLWQLIAIYLLAHFVKSIAPLFSCERNFVGALKVLAFALTPMWFGEIFFAIPVFSLDRSMPILSLFYTGYMLYLGLSIVMKASSPKALLYTGTVGVGLWGALKAPKVARAIDEFVRQWPVLDQSTTSMIVELFVVLFILSVVGVTVFYQRYGKVVIKASLYTGMVVIALWAPRIVVEIRGFFRQWPLFDESTKAMIVVIVILSMVGLTLLYERYRRVAGSGSDD